MSLFASDDQNRAACVLLLDMQTLLIIVFDMQLCFWGTGHIEFQIVTQLTSQSNRHHNRKVFISTNDDM